MPDPNGRAVNDFASNSMGRSVAVPTNFQPGSSLRGSQGSQLQRLAQQQNGNQAQPPNQTQHLQNGTYRDGYSLYISQPNGNQTNGQSTHHSQQNTHNEALQSQSEALRPQYNAHTIGALHNPTTLLPPAPHRTDSRTNGQSRRTSVLNANTSTLHIDHPTSAARSQEPLVAFAAAADPAPMTDLPAPSVRGPTYLDSYVSPRRAGSTTNSSPTRPQQQQPGFVHTGGQNPFSQTAPQASASPSTGALLRGTGQRRRRQQQQNGRRNGQGGGASGHQNSGGMFGNGNP